MSMSGTAAVLTVMNSFVIQSCVVSTTVTGASEVSERKALCNSTFYSLTYLGLLTYLLTMTTTCRFIKTWLHGAKSTAYVENDDDNFPLSDTKTNDRTATFTSNSDYKAHH